jgi:hypothetical protein
VAFENISFLLLCYQVLGDADLLDPIHRAMNFFLISQQGAPNPGWALQYTLDLKPAAARTYEPLALATHTTASNIGHLLTFFELTGDTRFLARVPAGLDWLERVKLPKPDADGRTHPTFVELQTNRALYVHRRGSNIANGEYYVDYDPGRTIGHYSATRRIDTAALRKRYEGLRNADLQALAKRSPLAPGTGIFELPRFFAQRYAPPSGGSLAGQARDSVGTLNDTGIWPAPLPQTSHPYRKDATPGAAKGDFATTHVGDEFDTSPFNDGKTSSISTAEYLRNMNVLIRWLEENRPAK